MKQLIHIVLSHIGKKGIAKYLWLGTVSGFSGFFFINTVTRVISILVSGKYTAFSKEYAVLFAATILTTVWSRRVMTVFSMDITQRISWSLRKQLLSLALQADYRQLSARKARIQSAILNDVGTLTNASLSSIDFFIQLIVGIACLVYIGSISMVLLLVTILVAALGIGMYLMSNKQNIQYFTKARKVEDDFQQNLNALLDGFKEIFMEPAIGKRLYDHQISANADESYNYNMKALTGLTDNQISGQVLYNLLIVSSLLFFSIWLRIQPGEIVSFVFTLLYLLGSIGAIVAILPLLMRARVASNQLMELKQDLEKIYQGPAAKRLYGFRESFEQISCKDLVFSYESTEESFTVGPISFTLQRGDITFIYGGNGSGKSTFLHTLIGLWQPSSGHVSVKDLPLSDTAYQEYRSLFAVVFADFYLFRDVTHLNLEKWDTYLDLFEMQGKVKLEGHTLSTVDLSTGQRKRLALILALMKERPVLVLDEWAADQDPYFRKKFYTEILPYLKQEGITVIAITHDDRYYHVADALYKMEEGHLYAESIIYTNEKI